MRSEPTMMTAQSHRCWINLVHIKYELRVACGVSGTGLAKMPDEVVPYKIFPPHMEP